MPACLICETPIEPFLDFGRMPIANGFLTPEQFADEYFFDLRVAHCPKCSMVAFCPKVGVTAIAEG